MSKKLKNQKIFRELERIANCIPVLFYWLDTDGIVLGLNDLTCISLGGLDVRDKIIGKANHSFYPKEVADVLIENNKKVIELGQSVEFEEKVANIKTGAIQYFTAVRSPLKNDEGEIIGIVGTSIEITDKKQAELHKLEIERLKVENKEERMIFVDNIIRTFQSLLTGFVNKDINVKQQEFSKITLTLREQRVLYAIYYRRNAKSAANFLSEQLKKPFTNTSVNTVVSKFLYPKFEVNSLDDLINKALLLKMIPLFFPEKKVTKNN